MPTREFLDLLQDPTSRWTDRGQATIFRLGNSGFVVAVDPNREEPWGEKDLNKFDNIFELLAVSVVACVQHDMVVAETNKLKEEFVQRQKMEVLGRLTSGIAHDFNNLLTVINSHSEIQLARLPENSAIREHVIAICEASQSAAELTSQLMVYSRKSITDPEVMDLNELVYSCEQILERVIGENVNVYLDLEPGLLTIKADRTQMEAAIMNLAVNARDAMPNGGLLKITTNSRVFDSPTWVSSINAPPGHYVELIISDSGVGIAEEHQSKIFDPYFTTKSEGIGSGLGLSVVHGAVKEADGQIAVEAKLGRGSKFTILIPLHSPQPRQQFDRPPKFEKRRERSAERATVLLIEDNYAVRRSIHKALTTHGFSVLDAGTGDEARELAQKHGNKIKILLTDIVMPDINGISLAKELLTSFPDWKLVFMSGYSDSDELVKGLELQSAEFIQKPFTIRQVANKLIQILHSNQSAPLEK